MASRKEMLFRYQKRTQETAVYPGRGETDGFIYCTLKLTGETGELLEKVLQTRPMKDAEEIVKELGDIMWYVASMSRELDSLIPEAANNRGMTASDVVVIATQISEIVGKALRDENGNISLARRELILERLALIVCGVEGIARGLGVTLEEVCEVNIEKLASRAARGVLHGSGDNR